MKLKITLILLWASMAAGFAQKSYTQKLDSLFDLLETNNKAMVSVAAAENGTVTYKRAIGWSGVNGSEPLLSNENSRYRIGSISKMFTAVLIFQLIEEGKLKLTDKLSVFYPRLPNAGKITIEQLLAHKSGLFDITDDPGFRQWKSEPKSEQQLLEIIRASSPVFEPGSKTEYSNSNFILLGGIIERLTKSAYSQALEKRITSRIGVKDTYLGKAFPDAGNSEVNSFSYTGKWEQERATHLSIPGGAGAVISTPSDLVTFITALFKGKLVSNESLNKMTDIKDKYGLGIVKHERDGRTLYGHGGGIDGFNALLTYDPSSKLAIAFTSNGRNMQGINIFAAMWDIIHNKPFEMPVFNSLSVEGDILIRYTGVYSSTEAPVVLSVSAENNVLRVQADNGPVVPLEPETESRFIMSRSGSTFEFDPAKGELLLTRKGKHYKFTKTK